LARQDREARRQADRAARRLRSDEGWLERHKEVFTEHETKPDVRRVPPGVVVRGDNYEEGSIEGKHVNGRLERTALPSDIHYGKVRVRAGGSDDVDWGDRSVPKRALPALSADDVGAATRQSVTLLRQQVRDLRWQIKQLQPRR
jgi:hypothetical protein